MKTLFTLIICMVLLACSDRSKQNASSSEESSTSQTLETSAIEAYMQLKDALVQTDAAAAKSAASASWIGEWPLTSGLAPAPAPSAQAPLAAAFTRRGSPA
ncbi:MAG: DUF3347 domain-containing protein [Planctomycetia bacterium]|nr:DUF3347 domain-containing protein [Planctomycetia bacterium]